MIISNMERVLGETDIRKLKSEENELFIKMQRQLMDMANFTDGTLFDNIKSINDHMSKKLAMRIDLRSASNLAAEKDKKDLIAKIKE